MLHIWQVRGKVSRQISLACTYGSWEVIYWAQSKQIIRGFIVKTRLSYHTVAPPIWDFHGATVVISCPTLTLLVCESHSCTHLLVIWTWQTCPNRHWAVVLKWKNINLSLKNEIDHNLSLFNLPLALILHRSLCSLKEITLDNVLHAKCLTYLLNSKTSVALK